MRLITRSFDNIPPEVLGYTIYAISTTKPQQHKDIPILWLFTPTYDIQIEYNLIKNPERFNEKIATILRQRASAIEEWVKANSGEKICLVCWENIESCHRRVVAEAIRQAGEKAGVTVTIETG